MCSLLHAIYLLYLKSDAPFLEILISSFLAGLIVICIYTSCGFQTAVRLEVCATHAKGKDCGFSSSGAASYRKSRLRREEGSRVDMRTAVDLLKLTQNYDQRKNPQTESRDPGLTVRFLVNKEVVGQAFSNTSDRSLFSFHHCILFNVPLYWMLFLGDHLKTLYQLL